MEFKFDQEKLEQSIIEQAVECIYHGDESIYDRINLEVRRQVSEAVAKGLTSQIEQTINSIMEKALDEEMQPVNIWGEREGKPTTIRAALHERAKNFWNEKVNSKGEQQTYGGMPRYEHIITQIASKEFDTQIKNNISEIAVALKAAVREGFQKQLDEKLNEFFKIKAR